MNQAQEWEVVHEKSPKIRRWKVPGGWLYQIQCGVRYIGHPSWNNTEPVFHEPQFVPEK